MIGVVVVTHGQLARELLNAAETIVGDLPQFTAVSIGWHDKTYSKHRAVVEGQVVFDSVETNPGEPYRTASIDVTVSDGNVTLEVGQMDEYTMLNWMSIVPKD